MLDSIKIVLLANTDWYLANFRFELACALRDLGAEIHCIAPQTRYLARLEEQGFHTHSLNMGDRSFSLAANYKTLSHLKELYRTIRPDIVHHFTPRCVVLGSMAARKSGVKYVINALTGLGHIFTSNSLKSRCARPILRAVLKSNLNGINAAVIFQNENDLSELVSAGVVDDSRCYLIRGSGVDPEKFFPLADHRQDNEIRVLFASRLIAEKGLEELVHAMKTVVEFHPTARLWIVGEPYPQNPTSLNAKDIEKLEKLPWVELFGHVDDVLSFLRKADIVALPSYREGTPKILLEAASCALPIVATDIAGCRGVVEHGVNGFLVPVKDAVLLEKAISALCEDSELRSRMGGRGREIIQNTFSSEIVIQKTLGVYKQLLTHTPSLVD